MEQLSAYNFLCAFSEPFLGLPFALCVSKLKVSLSARERKFHNTERLKIQFLDHNHMFLLVIQIQILRLKDELFWRSRLGFDCIED